MVIDVSALAFSSTSPGVGGAVAAAAAPACRARVVEAMSATAAAAIRARTCLRMAAPRGAFRHGGGAVAARLANIDVGGDAIAPAGTKAEKLVPELSWHRPAAVAPPRPGPRRLNEVWARKP